MKPSPIHFDEYSPSSSVRLVTNPAKDDLTLVTGMSNAGREHAPATANSFLSPEFTDVEKNQNNSTNFAKSRSLANVFQQCSDVRKLKEKNAQAISENPLRNVIKNSLLNTNIGGSNDKDVNYNARETHIIRINNQLTSATSNSNIDVNKKLPVITSVYSIPSRKRNLSENIFPQNYSLNSKCYEMQKKNKHFSSLQILSKTKLNSLNDIVSYGLPSSGHNASVNYQEESKKVKSEINNVISYNSNILDSSTIKNNFRKDSEIGHESKMILCTVEDQSISKIPILKVDDDSTATDNCTFKHFETVSDSNLKESRENGQADQNTEMFTRSSFLLPSLNSSTNEFNCSDLYGEKNEMRQEANKDEIHGKLLSNCSTPINDAFSKIMNEIQHFQDTQQIELNKLSAFTIV